jgi:hypothetical protein
MKKYFIFVILMWAFFPELYSQEREKEAHYFYLSLSTAVYTNAPGSFNQKLFVAAEFGRTYGIFDIGLLLGRLNLVKSHSGRDSSWFTEVLPTINVFSKGRFSEALTLGAGYVVAAKQNFLTEVTNSINFAPSNQIVLTVYQGNYYFDGKTSTSRAQFMGLSATFNFIKKNSRTNELRRKSLLN